MAPMTQLTEQQTREQESPGSTPVSDPKSSPSHATRAAAVVLLALLAAGGFTLARRFSEKRVLATETEKLAVPAVSVINPTAEPAQDELVLPAQLQAYVDSPIFARTNGYLMHWYKDIGARVKKGEILADIDTPEVDQELSQAKAARDQIQAQMDLAKISADRWTNLRKTDSVSQQEADQQTSAYTQARANLAAADANVHRLQEMESFKHVYAPFSGVVTKRNIDIGALINAGNAGQARELFDMAQFDPLRVYVSVPQEDASSIKPGMPAFIELREYPGQKFTGSVVRSADSIDLATRTMLTEVDVPNHDGKLLPGAYAQVHFAVPIQTVRISVPVNALLFRPEGPRVAVVGSDQKIRLAAVIIGRDFGSKIEILGGLKPTDQIVVNPADSLEEGQPVQIKTRSGA